MVSCYLAALLMQDPPDYTTEVSAQRPISAASAFDVRDSDLALRPIGSVQDLLRVTPGLALVQHSGGGKANQYFLRGFDIDHGTDLALSIDGIPINFGSHAHGQGYSDTNFIIPEVVERVQITKGPYFASQSDFATAGAINLVSREAFPHSSAGLGLVGSPGHGSAGYRGLFIASPSTNSVKATFAAEVGRINGPFDNPERWDRYKLFNKVTLKASPVSVTFGHMSYAGDWRGAGQIPARAVASGAISRWGSIDPDEGGATARHQIFAASRMQPTDTSEVTALAYIGSYRFDLFSNFTLFLNDPVNGDEIQQVDRRLFYGAKMAYRFLSWLGRLALDTRVGLDTRRDDTEVALRRTANRMSLATLRSNDVHLKFVGAYLNEEVTPARWVRLNLGGRIDAFSFVVDANRGTAYQWSPKANLIVTPVSRPGAQLDLYANYGHGFHSNDARGVFTQPAVTPLTRAIGAELGARTRLADRWDLSAALWQLDLANETVWVGDEGTTAVGDATRRRGVELDARCEITSWLAADVDVTFTRSRFKQDTGNSGGLALAPRRTWAGGLSARHAVGAGGLGRAGLRVFGIGDRPANDDGSLVAEGFTQIDLHVGYRRRWFDLALDVENLLDRRHRSAQFATTSRLPGEPAVGSPVPGGFGCGTGRLAPPPGGGVPDGNFYGCEDVSFTPAYPLTVRVMATLFLD